jgi:hypothetical protein
MGWGPHKLSFLNISLYTKIFHTEIWSLSSFSFLERFVKYEGPEYIWMFISDIEIFTFQVQSIDNKNILHFEVSKVGF